MEISETLKNDVEAFKKSKAQKLLIIDYVEPTDEQKAAIKLAAEKLADQIRDQEENCLKTIHTRYCIVKGLLIAGFEDISRLTPPGFKPSYYEYWYMFGTPMQAFLMSREIIIKDGNYILQILFNKELARGDENAADK